MIYEPNTRTWESGDLVIHDSDAKRSDMLMVVISYTPDGLVRTRYRDPELEREYRRSRGRAQCWTNELKYLHDPARFGIAVPQDYAATPLVEPQAELSATQRHLRVGDPVWYRRDDGSRTRHRVKYAPPAINLNGTWVVHLEGVSGYVKLDRVTPVVVTLGTLLADSRAILARIAEIHADVAAWNAARPEAPMEADPDGALAAEAARTTRLVAQLEARIADGQV